MTDTVQPLAVIPPPPTNVPVPASNVTQAPQWHGVWANVANGVYGSPNWHSPRYAGPYGHQ